MTLLRFFWRFRSAADSAFYHFPLVHFYRLLPRSQFLLHSGRNALSLLTFANVGRFYLLSSTWILALLTRPSLPLWVCAADYSSLSVMSLRNLHPFRVQLLYQLIFCACMFSNASNTFILLEACPLPVFDKKLELFICTSSANFLCSSHFLNFLNLLSKAPPILLSLYVLH